MSTPDVCSSATLLDGRLAHGSLGSSVILGTRVRLEGARRSDLLSAIGETAGEATLPGMLSVEDVRLWETACVVTCEATTDELVRIIQVWDHTSR